MGIAGALQKGSDHRLDSARLYGKLRTGGRNIMTKRPENTRDKGHAGPAGSDPMRVVLAIVGVIGALAIFAMNMGE